MPVTPDVEMHIPEETSLLEPEQLAIPVTPQPPISPKTRSETPEVDKPVYITRYGRQVKPRVLEQN